MPDQGREVKIRVSGAVEDVAPLVTVLAMLARPSGGLDPRDALAQLGISVVSYADRCVPRRRQKPENTTWELVLRVASEPKGKITDA